MVFFSAEVQKKNLFMEDIDRINREKAGTNTLGHKHNHLKLKILQLLFQRAVIGANEHRKQVIMCRS